MLWQRLTFGSLMIAALIGLFWADAAVTDSKHGAASWRHGAVVVSVWSIIAVFAARELAALFRHAGHHPSTVWAAAASVAMGLTPWLCDAPDEARASLLVMCMAVIGAFVMVAIRRAPAAISAGMPGCPATIEDALRGAAMDAAVTAAMIAYIGLLGSYIPRIRVQSDTPWLLLYLILVIKSADIGAFFFGRSFGRTKLIPWLSPKKTWEGLAGGAATAALISLLLAWGLEQLVNIGAGNPPHPIAWPGPGRAAVLGFVLALTGQAGDLLESLIKRSVSAKDSGQVVPAFGGLLDILDSPLVCAPVAYWLMLK